MTIHIMTFQQIRQMRKAAGTTLVASLSIAIGLTAAFVATTLIWGLLIAPLSYPNGNELMRISTPDQSLSYLNFLDIQQSVHSFSELGAYQSTDMAFSSSRGVSLLPAASLTQDTVHLLGASPIMGRLWTQDSTDDDAVLISNNLWTRTFNKAPDVIRKTVELDGKEYSIIGVMPDRFRFPDERPADVWMRLVPTASEQSNRSLATLQVIGRLTGPTMLAASRTEARDIAKRLQSEYPVPNRSLNISVEPYSAFVRGSYRIVIVASCICIGCVIILAMANTSILQLLLIIRREYSISVKRALGAPARQIVGEQFVHTALLFTVGSILAIAASLEIIRWINQSNMLPSSTGVLHMSPEATFLSLAIMLICVVAVGIVPCLLFLSHENFSSLRGGGRIAGPSSRSRRWMLKALIAIEVAAGFGLLAGSAMTFVSLQAMLNRSSGFRTEHVTSIQLWPVKPLHALDVANTDDDIRLNTYNHIVDSFRSIVGHNNVGLISALPLTQATSDVNFKVIGRPYAKVSDEPTALIKAADAGYFSVMGSRIIQGSIASLENDRKGAFDAVVNQSFAKEIFPGQNPVGQQLDLGLKNVPFVTITGVTSDMIDEAMSTPTKPEIDVNIAEISRRSILYPFLVGSQMNVVLYDPVRRVANSDQWRSATAPYASRVMVKSIDSMEHLISISVRPQTQTLKIMSIFALISVVLVVIGIYAVLAFTTSEATKEYAIKLTLGASRPQVFRSVVYSAIQPALAGVLIGSACLGLSLRLIQNLLYGLAWNGLAVVFSIAAAVVLVSALAAIWPAYSACQTSPMQVIRS